MYGPNTQPVVLDLDDDGLELVDLPESSALFDADGDGFVENMGWVSGDDGFLVHDLDGSGAVDDAAEIVFADRTADPLDTDLQAVAALYDVNADGVLDASDPAYVEMGVWQDWNQHGVTQDGELKSLADLDITAISLVSDGVVEEVGANVVQGRADYTRLDGTHGVVGDVGLAVSGLGYRIAADGGIEFGAGGDGLVYVAQSAPVDIDVATNGYAVAYGSHAGDTMRSTGLDPAALSGMAGDDAVIGGRGDDWLDGGAGADRLDGGDGHDILFYDAEDEEIDGGAGYDVAIATDARGVEMDLTEARLEAIFGGAGDDGLFAQGHDGRDLTMDGGGRGLDPSGRGSAALWRLEVAAPERLRLSTDWCTLLART